MNLNKEISLSEISQAIKTFIYSLELYKEKINNLNVFPVPDGDTGTNMLLTIKNVDQDLDSKSDMHSLLTHLRQASLMEARGNSGVILSQFFQGLLTSYESNKCFTISSLVTSFTIAAENTRKSLPNPVDGTMMTVYEEIARAASKGLSKSENLEDLLEIIAKGAVLSVKNTPNKLKILREAGVVDSGGLGLAIMMNAWYLSIIQKEIEKDLDIVYLEMISGLSDKVSENFINSSDELEWGNCTVFTIKGENFDIDYQRKQIAKFGKSPVITGDSNLIKVHIHVLDENEVINYSKKIGTVENIFVQNMDDQTKIFSSRKRNYDLIKTSVISICEGNGIVEAFFEAAGDGMHIVEGGSKNNPSIKIIMNEIDKIKSDNIIILPNNSNISTTVKQLIDLNNNKKIHMIPTRSIQQGIASIFSYDSSKNFDINLKNMNDSLKVIEEAFVTISTRDVVFDGKQIKKNNFFATLNNKIYDSYDSADLGLISISRELLRRNEILTIFVGHDSIMDNYDYLENQILDNFTDKEVVIVDGNQSYYNYLLLAE